MNKSSAIGFYIAFAVIYFGVLRHSPNPVLFLDPHALVLVCGGTLAAAFIAFPLKKIFKLFDFIFLRVLFNKGPSDLDVAKELIFIQQGYTETGVLEVDTRSHPFLTEIARLIQKSKFKPEELHAILTDRILLTKKNHLSDAKTLNALAKFPPAFGLLGASTGMISMMMGLGKGGAEQIGPAMAIALVATFWGIAVANLILLPLSDHAARVAAEEFHTRTMIKKCILLLLEKCSTERFQETVSGCLSLDDRFALKQYMQVETTQVMNATDPDVDPHAETQIEIVGKKRRSS